MSWSDKDIDNLFREAASNGKKPVYHDSYFDEIANLLPQKKGRNYFYWTFFAVISVFTVGSILFVFNKDIKSQIPKATSRNFDSDSQSETKIVTLISENIVVKNKFNYNQKEFSDKVKSYKLALEDEISTGTAYKSEELDLKNEELRVKSEELKVEHNIFEDEVSGIQSSIKGEQIESLNLEQKINQNNSMNESREEKTFFEINTLNYYSLSNPVFNSDLEKSILALNLPSRKKKHFLVADLGLGFSESFVNSGGTSSKIVQTYALGLAYKYRLNNYAFEIGFNFMNYKPTGLQSNRESKVYGFEVERYRQEINYKLISTLELPLMISRRIKNQTLSIGIAPSLTLGSIVDFKKTKNDIDLSDERIYGNKTGLTDFGLKPQVYYTLNLKNNFEFGAKISTNVLNSLNETKFEGKLNNLPIQTQITLRKTITLK
ncbi:MAG: hypothetical protein V4622_10915 [Bacteroidota bacterium]